MEGVKGECLISRSFTSPDSHNMNNPREHMPSPVNQHILWSSQLKGMERSVCSFKSFISIVPPNPRPELYKPLPPTPDLTPVTPSFPPTVSKQTSTASPWTASEDLEWTNSSSSAQRSLSSPLLSSRRYSPPPPKPPSKLSQIEIGTDTSLHKSRMVRPPPLKLDQEKLHAISDLPSRSPARHSRSQTICSYTTAGFGMPSPSMDRKRPGSSSGILKPVAYNAGYLSQPLPALRASFLDIDDCASDVSTEVKSLAWSSIGSPRATKFDWGEVQNVATVMEVKVEPQKKQMKQSTELYTSHRRGFVLRDGFQERELVRKLEQFSFGESQQARQAPQRHIADVLLHKQDELPISVADTKAARSFYPRRPSKDLQTALLPPTQAWRNSNSSFSCSTSLRLESDAKLNFDTKRRQKTRVLKTKTSGMDLDTLRRKESRLPNILTQSRSFTFSRKRTNLDKPVYKRCSSSAPSLVSPPPSPFEHPRFVPQIPGGFPATRKSPFDLPQLQISNAHDNLLRPRALHEYSPMSPSTNLSGSASGTLHKQLSLIQRSRAYANSGGAAKTDQYSPIPLPPSPYHRLHSSLSPTSPLAHEVPLPPTPMLTTPVSPQIPHSPHGPAARSFNCGNPMFTRQSESAEEPDNHIQNIVGKARHARETWRKRQQEIRRQKLKQSIKLVGPTDLAAAVGYIN